MVVVREQTPNSTKEVYKYESTSREVVANPAIGYRSNEGSTARQSIDNQAKGSTYFNQYEDSRLTPDSQFTDSRSSEMMKFNAHLYG